VRGLRKNTSFDVLKVNLLAGRGEMFHVDTLDLYAAKPRAAFIAAAASELELDADILKRDLGKLLVALEELQEKHIKGLLDDKPAVVLTEAEQEAALELLKDPQLTERILSDFDQAGLVGEETNKLTGYLAAVSRKLEQPLAVVVQSSSAAGKSSLMDAVLSFVPEEERIKYSAVTGQSLFYMGQGDLSHKVLAIVEEEGAERASYALKLLQSEGELCIASTGKDQHTGQLKTEEYRVRGPVMIFLTTTAIEVDEELLNRCLVLTVDEDREQTKAIHKLQRESQTLSGLLRKTEREHVLKVHQDAQRMLRPLHVVNPYAEDLTFSDAMTRTRRDHMKYLTLIRAIALLHQHQRPVRSVAHQGELLEYVEVQPSDIELANRLCHEVLGRSLDELPPQTRRLLHVLEDFVAAEATAKALTKSEVRFTRRELRDRLGLGDTQLKVHLARLVELEHVHVHRRGTRFEYELLYAGEGKDGGLFVPGLVSPANLHSDRERSGPRGDRSAPGRPSVGGQSALGRDAEASEEAGPAFPLAAFDDDTAQDARLGQRAQPAGRNGVAVEAR
jgi:hypothetical protein